MLKYVKKCFMNVFGMFRHDRQESISFIRIYPFYFVDNFWHQFLKTSLAGSKTIFPEEKKWLPQPRNAFVLNAQRWSISQNCHTVVPCVLVTRCSICHLFLLVFQCFHSNTVHVYNGCMFIYVVLSEASLLVFLFYSKTSPAK